MSCSKYEKLAEFIEDGDVEEGVEEARRLCEEGTSVAEIFAEGVIPRLKSIGERFAVLDLFLPDVLLAADVVKGIQEVTRSYMKVTDESASRGRVVIGTVFGDIHDIGKNIVGSFLEVNGYEVHDLGSGVDADTFLKRSNELKADVVALSSLLSTSIPYMEDTIEQIRKLGTSPMKVIVGGGPLTQEIADRIGADGYSDEASGAVALVGRLLASA